MQDEEAEDAGHFLLVNEGGVGVHGEPGVVIEDGVVDTIGSVGANVGRGDAEVLDEGREVGAGAEIANANVLFHLGVEAAGATAGGGVAMGLVGVFLGFLPLVVDGAAFGAGDLSGDFADELLEGWDGSGVEIRAGYAYVGIEVGYGVA